MKKLEMVEIMEGMRSFRRSSCIVNSYTTCQQQDLNDRGDFRIGSRATGNEFVGRVLELRLLVLIPFSVTWYDLSPFYPSYSVTSQPTISLLSSTPI